MSSNAHLDDEAIRAVTTLSRADYAVLRHPRRLRLLTVLEEAAEALSTAELATELTQYTDDDRRSVTLTLVHIHLPKLADHGVIEYDDEEIELVDDAPVPPNGFLSLLESADKRLLEILAHPERLAILTAIEQLDTCTLETLASTLVEAGLAEDLEEATIALHHSHLPALEDVGAVRHDGIEQIVALEYQSPTVD